MTNIDDKDDQSARQLLRELRLLRHFRGHENILTIKVDRLQYSVNSFVKISAFICRACDWPRGQIHDRILTKFIWSV